MRASNFPNMAMPVILILIVGLPLVMSTTLAIQIAIFALGTLSVSLLLGGVGILSFGQGLYVGVGAYAAGILLRDFQLALAPTIVLATVLAGAVALVIGAVIVRRQGVYLVMLTLAFAQMGYFAMLAFKRVTGGENGLTGVPRHLSVLGIRIDDPTMMYCLAASIVFIVFAFVQRLLSSPFGSVLAAIKQNEARCEALGYPVSLYKAVAFALAGAIAGLAGALHVISLGYVSPNNIELEMSQRLLVMSVIGGVSSPGGALAGAIFYEVVSEALSSVWPRWLALVALLLVGIVLFVPGGLWSLGSSVVGAFRGRKHV